MKYKKKKFQKHFITGGAGFIGSHLCEHLLETKKNKVICYDNLLSGSLNNVSHLLKNKNFFFIKGDVLNSSKLIKNMKGVDVVWHLASYTYINEGNKDPDRVIKNNFYITKNVLDAMVKLKIKNIIYSSSATIYGDLGKKKISEDSGPLKPLSIYGASKLASEALISAYSHIFDIEALIFRFSTVVGARMDHGVILDFIKKLKKTLQTLEILGNGKQKKPFLLIDDCIQGMLFVLKKYHFEENSDIKCEIFNLGPVGSTSINRVADFVIEEMHLKNVIKKCAGSKRGWKGDVPYIHFNINKIKQLGWTPKHSSDESVRIAIKRLLKYNKNHEFNTD